MLKNRSSIIPTHLNFKMCENFKGKCILNKKFTFLALFGYIFYVVFFLKTRVINDCFRGWQSISGKNCRRWRLYQLTRTLDWWFKTRDDYLWYFKTWTYCRTQRGLLVDRLPLYGIWIYEWCRYLLWNCQKSFRRYEI